MRDNVQLSRSDWVCKMHQLIASKWGGPAHWQEDFLACASTSGCLLAIFNKTNQVVSHPQIYRDLGNLVSQLNIFPRGDLFLKTLGTLTALSTNRTAILCRQQRSPLPTTPQSHHLSRPDLYKRFTNTRRWKKTSKRVVLVVYFNFFGS